MSNILLVEDHDANRTVLRRRLERRGHHVEEAADGAEAIARFRINAPDVVVMDLSMPNMGGLEALGRIRALSAAGAAVPAIALTAHAMGSTRQACLEAGFSEFMTKPIDFQALLTFISRLSRQQP